MPSRRIASRTSTGFVVIHVHAFELQIGITNIRTIATDAVFIANHLSRDVAHDTNASSSVSRSFARAVTRERCLRRVTRARAERRD